MGLLIAGAQSTGTSASWLVTFLASHPAWKAKGITEINDFLAAYNKPVQATPSLAAFTGSLLSIPLEAWESQTPTLDAIIGETLRLAQPHTALR
ncbi:hypothetical protein EVJ58_g3713 [Rhodofomes roseus]|uniref:Uncharacterized protein n=1 Tax=Rhodofomes roseus TaxID=34475 RepID=A0A4Y9YLK4_9APHY|nr:hypothetical protein EVJ58_g3713 [Rhodofomes roseus]